MATSRRGTRILKASDIMKRKGIVQKQMDMDKFNEVVENFFIRPFDENADGTM